MPPGTPKPSDNREKRSQDEGCGRGPSEARRGGELSFGVAVVLWEVKGVETQGIRVPFKDTRRSEEWQNQNEGPGQPCGRGGDKQGQAGRVLDP